MPSHKKTNVFLKIIARMILGWRKMSRRARILIVSGTVMALAAAVAIVVLPQGAPASAQATTNATPEAIATPVSTPASSSTPVPTTPPEESADITLKAGDENEAVSELQIRLMNLGYLDIDESTGLFGPATEHAIKLFQRQYSFDQTGVADYNTQMHLFADDAQDYMIKTGTDGSDVTDLQHQLIDLGYLASNKATGHYGDDTTKAVKDFQKANKLSSDGVTGPATLELVYSPDAIATPEKGQAIRSKVNIEEMIAAAKSKLGKPYVSGAEGPNSFDCSGLAYYCLKAAGSNRGRYNAAGYSKVSDWDKITSKSALKRGDLVFYWNNAHTKIGHVGIYIGGGYMIDASSSKGKVVKRPIFSNALFYCGRRPW